MKYLAKYLSTFPEGQEACFNVCASYKMLFKLALLLSLAICMHRIRAFSHHRLVEKRSSYLGRSRPFTTIIANSIPASSPSALQSKLNGSANQTLSRLTPVGIWVKKFVTGALTVQFFKRILSVFISDPDVLSVLAKFVSGVLWVFFALSLLGTFGIDTKPLISLFSISGLTIGFAAKDILKDTFASAYIMLMRPFKRGWTISIAMDKGVGTLTGTVISCDPNWLKLDSEGKELIIPTQTLYGKAITVEGKY